MRHIGIAMLVVGRALGHAVRRATATRGARASSASPEGREKGLHQVVKVLGAVRRWPCSKRVYLSTRACSRWRPRSANAQADPGPFLRVGGQGMLWQDAYPLRSQPLLTTTRQRIRPSEILTFGPAPVPTAVPADHEQLPHHPPTRRADLPAREPGPEQRGLHRARRASSCT